MRKLLLIATVFMAAMLFDLRPAPAATAEGPWCAVVAIGWGDVSRDCRYATFEACRPHVLAGNRGFCDQNPNWPGWYSQARVPAAAAPVRGYKRRH